MAFILFLSILANRLGIVWANELDISYLIPTSQCGFSSLALSLIVMFGKKNNLALHSVWYISIIGAIITFFYPDFIGQNKSIFYINTFTGLLNHNMSLLLCLTLLVSKWFVPTIKKFNYLFLDI